MSSNYADKAPDLQTIKSLFDFHIKTHLNLPESARIRDLGSERELIRDYSGRVVFELLQNALDRCEKRVLVALCVNENNRMLLVANDGNPVTAHEHIFSPEGESGSPTKGSSDFHALLSLHSSTKSARESIGNKGVGFRSVFASSTKVAVWSRCNSARWWSLEMEHPAYMSPSPDVKWNGKQVASFYCPLSTTEYEDHDLAAHLKLNHGISDELKDLVTLVALPDISPDHIDETKDILVSIRQLQDLTLGFLKEKYLNKDIQLDIRIIGTDNDAVKKREIGFEEGWTFATGGKIPMTLEMRDKSGLELEEGSVLVAIPPENNNDLAGKQTIESQCLYWSYLPTEQPAGFGVQIHGDFYLNNSRRNVTFRFGNGDEPQFYNGKLLVSAATAIVHGLWTEKDVLERNDFWNLLNPNSCKCEHLKKRVAEQLLKEEQLCRIIQSSFPSTKEWKLQRYQDFFKAINDWADYAYRIPGNYEALGKIKDRFYRYVKSSNAPIFPIIGVTAEAGTLVSLAIPLAPKLEAGGGARVVNVYYRSPSSSDKAETIDLPDVLKRQQSFVTSFRPDGMNEAECGMVDFNRVEILGRLTPGNTPEEYSELLLIAIRFATERAERGAQETVLDKCLERKTPGWRFLLATEAGKTANLSRAAKTLAKLHVPVIGGGWLPAHEVTFPAIDMIDELNRKGCEWPWPILDRMKFGNYAEKAAGNQQDDFIISLCMLFGITPGPVFTESSDTDKKPLLDSFCIFSEDIRDAIANSIIYNWNTFLEPLYRPDLPAFNALFAQLEMSEWIPVKQGALDVNIAGGRIKKASRLSTIDCEYIAPYNLWVERLQGGFRTRHLNTFVVSEKEPPIWTRHCGVVDIGQLAKPDKIISAIQEIREYCKPEEIQELYTRLIKSLNEETVRPDVPVLTRRLEFGKAKRVDWKEPGENVFFDSGDHSSYLSGFESISVWVVRRDKQKIASALGIITFNPKKRKKLSGDRNREMENSLRQRINRALPDIFAASSIFNQQSENFNEAMALESWARLDFQNYQDVWLELAQEGLGNGHIGHNEKDNIFIDPDDSRNILFDLEDPKRISEFLLECSGPLSEALCKNRAFLPAFSQVLTAWSHADNRSEDPLTVLRMRRDLLITDDVLADARTKIEASVIPPDTMVLWIEKIKEVLFNYGSLPDEIEIQPGSTINQAAWVEVLKTPCTEESLAHQLNESLADLASPDRLFLVPNVDFVTLNKRKLLDLATSQLDRILAMHAVFEKLSQPNWQELLDKKTKVLDTLKACSGKTISILYSINPSDIDLIQTIKNLVGLTTDPEISDEIENVLSFLKEGILPVSEKNIIREGSYTANPWLMTGSSAPLKPQDNEERELSNKQKLLEGTKAELGLLKLATKWANEWRDEDEAGFWENLSTTLAGHKETSQRINEAQKGNMDGLLHVSTWWGNAGFDVIVPNKLPADGGWSFLHVEVKRVSTGNNGWSFHLSENERRKAMDLKQKDPFWRIWLVLASLPETKVIDVTQSLPDPTKINEIVEQLYTYGMRPESYNISMT